MNSQEYYRRSIGRSEDSNRLRFLADAQIGVSDAIYSEQFRLSQEGVRKLAALRRAIDKARRSERGGRKK